MMHTVPSARLNSPGHGDPSYVKGAIKLASIGEGLMVSVLPQNRRCDTSTERNQPILIGMRFLDCAQVRLAHLYSWIRTWKMVKAQFR